MQNVLGFLGEDFPAQQITLQSLVGALADRGYRIATVIEGHEPDGLWFVPYMAPREEIVVTLRNPVQRGHRFHGKADNNPVIADSR